MGADLNILLQVLALLQNPAIQKLILTLLTNLVFSTTNKYDDRVLEAINNWSSRNQEATPETVKDLETDLQTVEDGYEDAKAAGEKDQPSEMVPGSTVGKEDNE